jgi:hypothetical protein
MSLPPGAVCTTVEVSWDGTGLYSGPFDDVTSRVPGDPGLVVDIGKDGSRTLDPPRVSSFDFELYNDDGRYSQERPDSPVYQRVVPGRPVRATLTHGESDVYDAPTAYTEDDYYDGVALYRLAQAAVDDISQTTGYGRQRVGLACLGIEQVLVAGTVTVGLMTAPRVDQCITAILDAIGWPSGDRQIAIADTTLAYWWCDDTSPWDALVELLRSEGPGALYVAPSPDATSGAIFHFENRNYRATQPRCTTAQATYFDVAAHPSDSDVYDFADEYDLDDMYDGTTSGLWFTDLSYAPGFANIRNRATYTIKTRQLAALGVIWTYGASITLGAAQSVTLIARPSDPFTSAVVPVSGADFTISGGAVSVSMAASSGLVAFITLTATSGTPTISALQLRGQALTVIGETTVQNDVDASASIAKFSPIPGQTIPRVFDVGGWPEIAASFAQGVCNAWVSRYMQPRPAVEITVPNGTEQMIREILGRRISDRITLTERNTGLQADVWINQKTVEVSGASGRRLAAVFRCEKVEEVAGTVWDGATWDITDGVHPAGIWGV